MSVKKIIQANKITEGNTVSIDGGLTYISKVRGEELPSLTPSPDGVVFAKERSSDIYKDLNNLYVGTIATAWTPESGQIIRLLGGNISVNIETSLLFEDNASGSTMKFRTPTIGSGQPYFFEIPGQGILLSAADNVLKITAMAGTGVRVNGTIWGSEE